MVKRGALIFGRFGFLQGHPNQKNAGQNLCVCMWGLGVCVGGVGGQMVNLMSLSVCGVAADF